MQEHHWEGISFSSALLGNQLKAWTFYRIRWQEVLTKTEEVYIKMYSKLFQDVSKEKCTFSCVSIHYSVKISRRWCNVFFPARYYYTTEEEKGAVTEGALGYLVVFGYCFQSIYVCFGVLILVTQSRPHQYTHTLCCCRLLPYCLFLSSGVKSIVGACKPCGLEKRRWFPLIFPLLLRAFIDMATFLPPASSKCLVFWISVSIKMSLPVKYDKIYHWWRRVGHASPLFRIIQLDSSRAIFENNSQQWQPPRRWPETVLAVKTAKKKKNSNEFKVKQ